MIHNQSFFNTVYQKQESGKDPHMSKVDIVLSKEAKTQDLNPHKVVVENVFNLLSPSLQMRMDYTWDFPNKTSTPDRLFDYVIRLKKDHRELFDSTFQPLLDEYSLKNINNTIQTRNEQLAKTKIVYEHNLRLLTDGMNTKGRNKIVLEKHYKFAIQTYENGLEDMKDQKDRLEKKKRKNMDESH